MKTGKIRALLIAAAVSLLLTGQFVFVQGQRDGRNRGSAKPVTVPVTIRLREPKREVEMRFVDYVLREDGEEQTILSIRKPSENPITLAILIQDDLVSSISNETRGIANFVRRLPPGSRVMIGYIRSGSLDVRRKFTSDLEKAAAGLRSPMGLAIASPYNPFVEVIEGLRRFDSQPLGRRAIMLVSDGLDTSRGVDSSSPGQSLICSGPSMKRNGAVWRSIQSMRHRPTAPVFCWGPMAKVAWRDFRRKLVGAPSFKEPEHR